MAVICDSLSAFPAFLDTELNSSFETWHSHLFVSNWLFCRAPKSSFPLTSAVTPQESEVQLNCFAKSADGFYGNWLVFWDFINLSLATKWCCCVPLFCFSLLVFGLPLPLLLWHLRMMVLKSRGLGIYWAHDQIINNLKRVAPLRFVSWHVHNSTHRYLSVPWMQSGL